MESDGSNLVNLTLNEAYDGTPTWSPDGLQIAFTSERNGNPDIFLMNADGTVPSQLTDGGGFNVIPDWSPDGSKILFVSNRTYELRLDGGRLEVPGNTKLWFVEIDGGRPDRLTTSLGMDIYGSWSPDGESVVFMSVRDDNPEIYLLRPDKFEENLTNSPARDLNPEWSPDGTKILFMSDRDGNMEIYMMDMESEGAITNLTNHPSNDGDPAWSPDGTKIVFTSDRDENIEIYIMDADGSNPQRLTDDPADDIHPHWQP
jgi:TolB protein